MSDSLQFLLGAVCVVILAPFAFIILFYAAAFLIVAVSLIWEMLERFCCYVAKRLR